jgi:hypothetical protein
MRPFRYVAGSIVLLSTALTSVPAEAVFHLWYIKEVYTNHDGTVQFIELFTSSGSQNQTGGEQIVTGSGGIYTFSGDVIGGTANKHLLLATSTFDALPNSPPPNFAANPLPQNFFNPAGDTINFVGADSKTFTAATAIPIDGVSSRSWPSFGSAGSTIGTNSPTNFAYNPTTNPGGTGSIVQPPPPSTFGDFNDDGFADVADYVAFRKTLTLPAVPKGRGADADMDGTIDPGDYAIWVKTFGNTVAGAGGGGSSPIPEPSMLASSLLTWATLSIVRRRRS